MYSLSWVGITDPDIYHYIFHSQSMPPVGANRGRYANPEIDRLLDESRVTLDIAARKEILSQVQKILAHDLVYVSLWWKDNVVVQTNRLSPLLILPGGGIHIAGGREVAMTRYIARRLFLLLPTVLGVATLVFFLIHLVPGDPVEAILGEYAQPAQKEALTRSLGLDAPLAVQYGRFLKGVATADLGESIFFRKPVTEVLAERIPATVHLALAGMGVAILIALPLGILAAVKRGTWIDHGSMLFALGGISMPNFWLGPLLILLFAIHFTLLPASGRGGAASLVLPAITLGTALAAMLSPDDALQRAGSS